LKRIIKYSKIEADSKKESYLQRFLFISIIRIVETRNNEPWLNEQYIFFSFLFLSFLFFSFLSFLFFLRFVFVRCRCACQSNDKNFCSTLPPFYLLQEKGRTATKPL
jgi:hypothetical protein